MTRHELIGKYELKNYSITNEEEVTYKYFDKYGVRVCLEHFSENYWFEVVTDNKTDVISSLVFSDYTNEDMFDLRYREFLKFYGFDVN